jgi:hypothetical protein
MSPAETSKELLLPLWIAVSTLLFIDAIISIIENEKNSEIMEMIHIIDPRKIMQKIGLKK